MREVGTIEKGSDKNKTPKWAKSVLIVTLMFYIWYFASTLLLPLAEFLGAPDGLYLTFYKMVSFPPSILGFILCISLISTIIVILEFKEQNRTTKIFLTESITFMLYFIIPIIATIFLLVLVTIKSHGQITTEAEISYFLGDLFLFTSVLFLMTSILNIATQRMVTLGRKKIHH